MLFVYVSRTRLYGFILFLLLYYFLHIILAAAWAEELAIGVRDLVFALYVYVAPLSWSGDPRVQ